MIRHKKPRATLERMSPSRTALLTLALRESDPGDIVRLHHVTCVMDECSCVPITLLVGAQA